jgi:hypothetical protein
MAKAKSTVDELRAAVDEYFEKCRSEKVPDVYGKTVVEVPRPPSMEGLALHLGIHRATLYRYADGTVAGDSGDTLGEDVEARDSLRDIITRAKDRMYKTHTRALHWAATMTAQRPCALAAWVKRLRKRSSIPAL